MQRHLIGRVLPLGMVMMGASAFAQSQPSQPSVAAPSLPYGAPISDKQAQIVMNAAEAEARQGGWSVAIAIVEPSGDLVMFKKLGGTGYLSTDVSMRKARTSAATRAPSKAFADRLSQSLVPLSFPHLIPAEGAVPIILNGHVIGAIGVSGVASKDDDARIATVGANAVR